MRKKGEDEIIGKWRRVKKERKERKKMKET
jgi:hypothetical protein